MAILRDKIWDVISEYEKEDFNSVKALEDIMGEIIEEHKWYAELRDKEVEKIKQRGLRPALKWFAELMETDLIKNDSKGGWLDGKIGYYWGKALEHIMELRPVDSVRILGREHAIGKCFKAANYLMMIAHNLIEELRKEKEGME